MRVYQFVIVLFVMCAIVTLLGFAQDQHPIAERLRITTSLDSEVWGLAFRPDGRMLASASLQGPAQLWDVATGREVASFGKRVDAVVFCRDGTTLAYADAGEIRLRDVTTAAERTINAGDPGPVLALGCSPDGRTVAIGCRSGNIWLRDVATGGLVSVLKGHTGFVKSVAFSPDGKTLASGGRDSSARLWDLASGTQRSDLTGHGNEVTSVTFSPDGTTVASASHDGTVRLWDTVTRRQRLELRAGAKYARAVVFSPNGKVLAFTGWDAPKNRIQIRRVVPGPAPYSAEADTSICMCLAFSPDGRTLAAGGDGYISLLDVPAAAGAW